MKQTMLTILLLGSFAKAALATKIMDLYQQNVVVANQSSELREQAFQQGLQQQLIKLSGDSHIADKVSFAKAIKDPTAYIAGYSYQGNMLIINFQPQTINNLLRKASSAVWPAERPAVLIWVIMQNAQHNYLLGMEPNDLAFDQLKTLAQQRGIPLLFPKSDVNGRLITLADIQRASKQYKYDVLIIARLTQNTDDSWTGNTQLLTELPPQQWQFTGKNNIDLMIDSMNVAFDAVAERYVVSNPTIENIIMLTVTQINDIAQYADAMRYLKHFSLTKNVALQKILPTQLQLKLTIIGEVNDFKKALNLSNHVIVSPASSDKQLIYSWQN